MLGVRSCLMKKATLRSLYSFPGFQALSTLKEVPEDPGARIIVLRRRQKKRSAPAVTLRRAFTIGLLIRSEIWILAAFASIWSLNTAEYLASGVRP